MANKVLIVDDEKLIVKGLKFSLEQEGMQVDCGMDLVVYGNIPNSSGLSSSASVEVLTGCIMIKTEFL